MEAQRFVAKPQERCCCFTALRCVFEILLPPHTHQDDQRVFVRRLSYTVRFFSHVISLLFTEHMESCEGKTK